jgi:hypothetical protein
MVKFRQLLITISIAATLVVGSALAQTNLTQILDTITNPDGTSFNGTVVITWNGYSGTGSGTVSRLSTSARVYNGALSVLLVPTTTASPGTYYQVVYTSSDATTSWTETWQVPPSTTALTIAAVRQTTTEGSGSGTSTGAGTGTGSGNAQYATLPIAMSNVTGLASSFSAINTILSGQGQSITNLTSNLSGLSTNITSLTNLVNGLNTTVSALSAGGSNVAFVDSEAPAGVINGTNVTFSLANTPAPATSLALFRNGLALTQGIDYTLAGSAITFTSATLPQPTDILLAYYRIPGTGATTNFTDNETPGGTINGVNTSFTLASAPNPSNSLRLFRNGVLLSPGGDYTLSGSAITIISATPQTGDSLAAYYRH